MSAIGAHFIPVHDIVKGEVRCILISLAALLLATHDISDPEVCLVDSKGNPIPGVDCDQMFGYSVEGSTLVIKVFTEKLPLSHEFSTTFRLIFYFPRMSLTFVTKDFTVRLKNPDRAAKRRRKELSHVVPVPFPVIPLPLPLPTDPLDHLFDRDDCKFLSALLSDIDKEHKEKNQEKQEEQEDDFLFNFEEEIEKEMWDQFPLLFPEIFPGVLLELPDPTTI